MGFVLHTLKLDRPLTYFFCHTGMSYNGVVRWGKWEDKKEKDTNRHVSKTRTTWRSCMMIKEWGWWWTKCSRSGWGVISCCSSFLYWRHGTITHRQTLENRTRSYYISTTTSISFLLLFCFFIVSAFYSYWCLLLLLLYVCMWSH
jgi:hypothetical protein